MYNSHPSPPLPHSPTSLSPPPSLSPPRPLPTLPPPDPSLPRSPPSPPSLSPPPSPPYPTLPPSPPLPPNKFIVLSSLSKALVMVVSNPYIIGKCFSVHKMQCDGFRVNKLRSSVIINFVVKIHNFVQLVKNKLPILMLALIFHGHNYFVRITSEVNVHKPQFCMKTMPSTFQGAIISFNDVACGALLYHIWASGPLLCLGIRNGVISQSLEVGEHATFSQYTRVMNAA